MKLIAKIKDRLEAKARLESSLGEFARGYNAIQDRIDQKILRIIFGAGLPPMVTTSAIGLALAPGNMNLGLGLLFAGLGWGLAITMPLAALDGPSKKLLPLSGEIYSAAGIDANPGFSDRLVPGKRVASFDHSFPDGRSGHVEVVCDNEGYPMVLFKENMPAAVLPAPRMREIAA